MLKFNKLHKEVKMPDEMCKQDIRSLLKTFGVAADEAIVGHIAKNPNLSNLSLKVTLEDNTQYSDENIEKISLEVTKEINCK
jgi:tRNA nucleotidyltransferase (CCA-adding enzyme)